MKPQEAAKVKAAIAQSQMSAYAKAMLVFKHYADVFGRPKRSTARTEGRQIMSVAKTWRKDSYEVSLKWHRADNSFSVELVRYCDEHESNVYVSGSGNERLIKGRLKTFANKAEAQINREIERRQKLIAEIRSHFPQLAEKKK